MIGISDEMVQAADRELFCADGWIDPTFVRAALEAALDVAPTVDGWWWCETQAAPTTLDDDGWCWLHGDLPVEHCPGPHRPILDLFGDDL